MPVTIGLARLALLKSDLFLDLTGTSSDNELKAAILAATTMVHQRVGRVLTDATYTDELYSGNNNQRLWLRNHPVTKVSAMKIWDGDAYTTESSTYYELIAGRYIQYPKRGQESKAAWGSFPEGDDNVKVTYDAGYDATDWATASYPDPGGSPAKVFDVPRDLELAVAKVAALIALEGRGVDTIGAGRLGIVSVNLGPESASFERYERGIPADALAVIDSYREPQL